MQRQHAPPGFWGWHEETAALEGVELESTVPTRFFQTVDAFPRSWGRLSWRLQLNKIVADRVGLPLFRTFYPGVEWNLSHPDDRWFLTAWLKWDQSGECGEPQCVPPVRIDGDTILFRIPTPSPECEGASFLRSRVDARHRRRIAETVRAQLEQTASADSGLILLDDLMDHHQPPNC